MFGGMSKKGELLTQMRCDKNCNFHCPLDLHYLQKISDVKMSDKNNVRK